MNTNFFSKTPSPFFRLNWQDILKGLITAFFTAFVTGAYELLKSGGVIDWLTIRPILIASVAAMLGYLIKNLFTNSEGKLFRREPSKIAT